MWSARIDQSYRAIIKKPDQGNVYVVLWVDNHDDAYDWAMRKKCDVHPETGSLQLYSVDHSTPEREADDQDQPDEPDLFDDYRDRELAQVGVPAELVPKIRTTKTLDDLADASDTLPNQVHEALFYLAIGESIEDIYREVVIPAEHQTDDVDPTDFEAALDNPNTQRNFVIVDDDNLEEVLSESLEKWRIFLHPMQRKIKKLDVNGPIRVLGGAGTGKTVVALHRAVWLARRLEEDSERILFTTYTRNLAADIKENLSKLCDGETLSKIEVVNLDRWVQNFLKRNDYDYDIKYYTTGDGTLDDLWNKALALAPDDMDVPQSFYREEWEYVVQAQGCATRRDYLRARRKGRGVPLRRPQRQDIWPVFEEYRNLLEENDLKERADAIRDARRLLEDKGDILPYQHIVLDEAQDMGEEALKLIRQMIPDERENDLFLVGDGHQRIYQRQVVMKHCGINIVGRNRSHRLRINYRTTDEIRRFAVQLLEGVTYTNLDGDPDPQDDYTSLMHGEDPEIYIADNFNDEVDHIVDYLASDGEDDLPSTCLITRTNQQLDQYREALEDKGVPTLKISRDDYDDRSQPGLRVATMHRVKGLEFDRVITAGLDDGKVPLDHVLAQTTDDAVHSDLEKRERSLLYVALTRAKTHALLTSSGNPSPWLDAITSDDRKSG